MGSGTEQKPASSFERLAAINVSAYTEKKNGLTYLSWAWAWDQLLRQDASASYAYLEPRRFGGDSVMVYCAVTAFGVERIAHLPVMDHRNKPIANPDAFAMNTAMQRCLVKAIALHGLGLYIYAGEDLPLGEVAESVTATIPAPPGYDEWLLTFSNAANGGLATLRAAYKAAAVRYRDYLTNHDNERYEQIKARAEAAPVEGA